MRNSNITSFASGDGPAAVDGNETVDAVNGGDEPISFSSAETRADDMGSSIESWLEELSELVDGARTSERFRAWLDVQSRFHDYSSRNTLLIACQRPDATHVAGYRTWQDEFDRQVIEDERAIWIWAPIIARRCPECGNSRRYHAERGCGYTETPAEDWSKGVVSYKPVPVFDVSQTAGEPLPELETSAEGDADDLLEALLEAAGGFDVEVRLVPDAEWNHGTADGVCVPPAAESARPRIEVRSRPSRAAVAGTLVHELAHARLHLGVEATDERSKREVEAEAVAYVVGRYFGLDTSNSAFYLAAWQDEGGAVIQERLERISATAERFIDALDG